MSALSCAAASPSPRRAALASRSLISTSLAALVDAAASPAALLTPTPLELFVWAEDETSSAFGGAGTSVEVLKGLSSSIPAAANTVAFISFKVISGGGGFLPSSQVVFLGCCRIVGINELRINQLSIREGVPWAGRSADAEDGTAAARRTSPLRTRPQQRLCRRSPSTPGAIPMNQRQDDNSDRLSRCFGSLTHLRDVSCIYPGERRHAAEPERQQRRSEL